MPDAASARIPANGVMVTVNGARRLRRGLPWVYRQDVQRPAEAASGEIVSVFDPHGNQIGRAFWAVQSPVAVRLLTHEDKGGPELLVRRVEEAAARRRSMFPNDDAYRVIHGEADLCPGVFVDRYGDGLSLQLLSEGAEAHRELLVDTLRRIFSPRVVVLRNDTSARSFEGLERGTTLVHGDDPKCTYREGTNTFEVNLVEERKTGAFLDQRENHLRAGEYARGEGLDAFTYHGGFALALARGCSSVLALDQDPVAAESARRNASRNGLANVTVEAANAFDALHEFDRKRRLFDTVVIDPPAFAKRKDGIDTALRAYKELNLRGLRILRPGGVLVSCSCSGKVTAAMFEEMLLDAAQDARLPVQILERRGPGRDHPALAGLPETEYLKCIVLRVLGE